MFVASWGVVVSSWLQSWGALRAILALVRGGVGWGGVGGLRHMFAYSGVLLLVSGGFRAPCWSVCWHHVGVILGIIPHNCRYSNNIQKQKLKQGLLCIFMCFIWC